MSVLIKGIEMPNNCQECICINDEYFYCQAVGRQPQDENVVSRRPDWCPIMEVPPHGRLIDTDAVSLEGGPYEYDEWCKWALTQYQDAPTIIEAEEET